MREEEEKIDVTILNYDGENKSRAMVTHHVVMDAKGLTDEEALAGLAELEGVLDCDMIYRRSEWVNDGVWRTVEFVAGKIKSETDRVFSKDCN